MPERRRAPRRNIPAAEVMEFLDAHATLEEDIDHFERRYINGVWVHDSLKRELRRYRYNHVRTIRPETLNRILTFFNLEEEWLASL